MLESDWAQLLRTITGLGLEVVSVDKRKYLITIKIPKPKK